MAGLAFTPTTFACGGRWHVGAQEVVAGRGATVTGVYLIAVLQNLGRLMLYYHFADEADEAAPFDHRLRFGQDYDEQP